MATKKAKGNKITSVSSKSGKKAAKNKGGEFLDMQGNKNKGPKKAR